MPRLDFRQNKKIHNECHGAVQCAGRDTATVPKCPPLLVLIAAAWPASKGTRNQQSWHNSWRGRCFKTMKFGLLADCESFCLEGIDVGIRRVLVDALRSVWKRDSTPRTMAGFLLCCEANFSYFLLAKSSKRSS